MSRPVAYYPEQLPISFIPKKNLAVSAITTSKGFVICQPGPEKSGVSNMPRTFGRPVDPPIRSWRKSDLVCRSTDRIGQDLLVSPIPISIPFLRDAYVFVKETAASEPFNPPRRPTLAVLDFELVIYLNIKQSE